PTAAVALLSLSERRRSRRARCPAAPRGPAARRFRAGAAISEPAVHRGARVAAVAGSGHAIGGSGRGRVRAARATVQAPPAREISAGWAARSGPHRSIRKIHVRTLEPREPSVLVHPPARAYGRGESSFRRRGQRGGTEPVARHP